MSDITRLKGEGQEMGLKDEALTEYIRSEQARLRDERANVREAEQQERARVAEADEARKAEVGK